MAAKLSVLGPLLSSPNIRGQAEAMAGPAKYCKCMFLVTKKKRNFTRKHLNNMLVSVSFIFYTSDGVFSRTSPGT